MARPSPMFVWTNIMGPVDVLSNRGAYIALLFPRKTSTSTHAYGQPSTGSSIGGGGPARNPANPNIPARVHISALSKRESRVSRTTTAIPQTATTIFWTTSATSTAHGASAGDDDVVISPVTPTNTTRHGDAAIPSVLSTFYGELPYVPVSTARYHGWVLPCPAALESTFGYGGRR